MVGGYGMIGESPAMLKVYDAIGRVAKSRAPVYIAGESGTGKELVARALHQYGPRQDAAFVAVNVTEFGDDALLESNLFGIESGVATGVGKRHGIFMQANHGTLFLDEIAEMSKAMQAKLLRVIQENSIVPIGGNYAHPSSLDVRLVAASSKPLETYVAADRFRDDLYYRLRGVYVTLPPLRERGDDIGLLADHFLAKYATEEEKTVRFHSTVHDWLKAQPWRGNVRELENTVRGAVAWTKKEELKPRDFLLYRLERGEGQGGETEGTGEPVLPPDASYAIIKEFARKTVIAEELRKRLALYEGNRSAAARSLGLDPANLRRFLVRYGIDPHTGKIEKTS